MPYNSAVDSFRKKSNFVADFLRDTERKPAKNGHFAFFDLHCGALEAGYGVHLRLIGKRVVNFLLVIIELFSLGAFVLSQSTHLTDGQMLITIPRLHSCSAVKC